LLEERALAFLEANPAAAMITVRRDGSAHAVRVGVAVVDGKIWSSGTQTRVRTKHLRRDPRATLFVYPAVPDDYRALALECTVSILEGQDAPDLHIRMFEQMQSKLTNPPRPGYLQWFGQEKTLEEFRRAMADEQRVMYEFTVQRAYGLY
jgi:PPOX class probable F420-dependent enzyme